MDGPKLKIRDTERIRENSQDDLLFDSVAMIGSVLKEQQTAPDRVPSIA